MSSKKPEQQTGSPEATPEPTELETLLHDPNTMPAEREAIAEFIAATQAREERP